MQLIEKTVAKNYVYKGKIISVRNDDALLPNGLPCKREIIEHSGGACVLCVNENSVLLVKQYRYAYGECVYEIPAGKLEKGEDPMWAAKRELEEEGGVTAGELKLLYVIYPTPGYTDEKIYLYEASNCQFGAAHLDEDEFLTAEFVPLEQVKQMLLNGEIHDSKTIIALQHYFLVASKR